MKQFHLLVMLSALGLGSAASAAGLINGSFEEGPNPGGFSTLGAGDTSITGWTVGGNSIDYIGSYWNASNGSRSIDLSGGDAGSVAQSFDTVIGQHYLVNFDLAGNPAGAPTVKKVIVSAGSTSSQFTFDTTGKSLSDMGWLTKSFSFVADATSTTLKFRSDNHTPFGPALDHVSVQAVPEPASIAALGAGALGLLRRRRK